MVSNFKSWAFDEVFGESLATLSGIALSTVKYCHVDLYFSNGRFKYVCQNLPACRLDRQTLCTLVTEY